MKPRKTRSKYRYYFWNKDGRGGKTETSIGIYNSLKKKGNKVQKVKKENCKR